MNQVPAGGPDVGSADPTDGRKQYDWQSRYPDEARSIIRSEATYVVCLLIASLLLILATWKGGPAEILSVTGKDAEILRKYCLYALSGLLGGAVYGLKYLYRVVARGYWHLDRRLWRFLSPLISLAVAFAFGTLLEASFLTMRPPVSGAAIVAIGFLTGYFADAAVAKMHEIADVLFGTTLKPKSPNGR